jgi:predicted nucleic acid-binding protein
MANVLGMSFRRRRLNELDLALVLRLFATLELHPDTAFPALSNSVLLPLMQAYTLTAYDAVYLELALRLNLPLATMDEELVIAARDAGVLLISHPK